MKTHDIGNDWFVNLHDDGSLTLRNSEIGQRVTIPAYSASLLYQAIRAAEMAEVKGFTVDDVAHEMRRLGCDPETAARSLIDQEAKRNAA